MTIDPLHDVKRKAQAVVACIEAQHFGDGNRTIRQCSLDSRLPWHVMGTRQQFPVRGSSENYGSGRARYLESEIGLASGDELRVKVEPALIIHHVAQQGTQRNWVHEIRDIHASNCPEDISSSARIS